MRRCNDIVNILKVFIVLICFCSSCIVLFSNSANMVYASTTDDSSEEVYEDGFIEGVDGEAYNAFYVPKTRFTSESQYKQYCERMYKRGYMDSDYNWTTSAQDCIENPTESNYQKMDGKAKQTVDERIRSGEMKAEESPYLTYDEIQKISSGEATYDEVIANRNITEEGSESVTGGNQTTPTATATIIPDETEISEEEENASPAETSKEETEELEMPDDKNTDSPFSMVKIVIMLAVFVVVAFVSYRIYKKQL